MTDATFRLAGTGQPIFPAPVTAAQTLLGDYDSALVQVEGQLIGQNRTTVEPTLAILSGNTLFAAVLPATIPGDAVPRLSEGSTVRITGICSVQVNALPMALGVGVVRPASFRILLRAPSDVVTIEQAPWWNRERSLAALAVVVAVAMSVFAWVVLLRKRVGEQTRAIALEKERYRSLVDHAPDIVFASDLEGNLTSVNPAAELLLGYTQEELLKRNVWACSPPLSGRRPGNMRCVWWRASLPVRWNARSRSRVAGCWWSRSTSASCARTASR
jgi:PAS domain-containing protein